MFAKDAILVKVKIPINSSYCGLNLQSLNLPKNCQCLGVIMQEKLILANDNLQLSSGDYIIAIALNPALVPELKFVLKKSHPIIWSSSRDSWKA